ncbi:hypothetical protein FRC03_003453 [Tulasnella sp. 419]|nr:hypothetical protein FRC03_003453 [Tulasnella sp. 419]
METHIPTPLSGFGIAIAIKTSWIVSVSKLGLSCPSHDMALDEKAAVTVAYEAEIKDLKDSVHPDHVHSIHDPMSGKLHENAYYEGTFSSERQYNEDGYEIPTEEELHTLRRVSDKIPIGALLIVIIEFAERLSYYGTTGPFANFIRNPLPEGGPGTGATPKGSEEPAGALNQGTSTQVAVTTFFSFWAYIMPVFGAIIADQYIGRFKAICWFTAVVGIGHILLTAICTPSLLQNNPDGAFAAFMVSLVIIGIGTGGVKANVSPLVAEQYTKSGQWIKTKKNGERVIVDSNLTVQRIFLYFYFMINVGSIGSIATVYAEKIVGFWLAFLIPTIVYLLMPIVLWAGYHRYVRTPPKGSVLLQAFNVIKLAYRGVWTFNIFKFWKAPVNWDNARPGIAEKPAGKTLINWDNDFVDEIKRSLWACKVFLLYPFYWIAYNQMNNNLTNQAAYMTTKGTPNDLLNNLNPLSIIIIIPIMDHVIYPGLRRFGIVVKPIQRITLGFFFASASMVYCAVLQHKINQTNPCGKYGGHCELGVSPISVWVQAPAYILIGISEIFTSITGLEYAYTKSPARMKSVVFAIFFLTTAFSNVFNFALVKVSEDPYVMWNYVGCAGAAFIAGIVFWFLFHKYDKEEDTINAIGKSEERRLQD